MRKETNQLSELIKPFENQWIAISLKDNSVIESKKSLKSLLDKMDKFNRAEFEIMKVPPFKPICAFLNEI